MLYIFWAVLNFFLAAGFLVIGYRAVKLIRIKYGLFAAVLLLCIGGSFFCNGDKENQTGAPMHSLNFHDGRSSLQFPENAATWHIPDGTAKDFNLKSRVAVVLHETPLFKIRLRIDYGVEAGTSRLAPLYAVTSFEGFHSGIEWRPLSPHVSADASGKKINYYVTGGTEWKLLNAVVYSAYKTFTGSVTVAD